MIIIDIIFFVFLIISILIGIRKGLIKQAGNIAAIVLAFIFSLKFYSAFSTTLTGFIALESYFLNVLSFVILFILFGALFFLVVLIVKRAVHSTPLVILDKIGGALLAFCIFFLIMTVILYGMSLLPLSESFNKSLKSTISFKTIDYVLSSPRVKNVYSK